MIKYECEICGTSVHTDEAIGSDVYDGDMRGRVFQWTAPNGERLTIQFERADSRFQQFCYGCMFRNVREMMSERFPDRVLSGPILYQPEEGLVFDDPTNSGDPGEDQELQELYTQGKLQEPRPDLASERPQRTCICPTRESDGSIVWQDPACPVHSPGGSSGEG